MNRIGLLTLPLCLPLWVLSAIAAEIPTNSPQFRGPGAPASDQRPLMTGTWSPPSSLETLTSVAELPSLFACADGRRVETKVDWERRREELKEILLYYQYGRVPERPDQVVVSEVRRQPHESGLGTMEFLTLEIDSTRKLRFHAVFYLPRQDGRRPVIIREEDRIGMRKDVPMFLEKGYIFVEFARHDLDPDRDRVVGTAQAAYPNHDWATLAVWAWCGMRLIDYLETRPDVDKTRIGITGHSRGGKMALLTAALDERISLVVPHQSGSGGAGCYRVLGPGAETLAQNDKPHWYHERIRWFGEREERLPFDQHFLKALVAPRALLCTESIDDEFANPLGSLVTSAAAQEVYEFLGAPEKNAIHFRRGGHTTETEDWARILEFAEWQFFGRLPQDQTKFWSAPFPIPSGYDSWKIGRKMTTPESQGDMEVELADLSLHGNVMEFLSVGQPDNAPDRELYGQGSYGAVTKSFQIAAGQVTNAEYAKFLNAVASQGDKFKLYHPAMSDAIVRVDSADGATFRVPKSKAESPVTSVSWQGAIRYCNWLHNSRPSGPQSAATTEEGAYPIDGDRVGPRRDEAKYFLPNEDEWYKAAYFGQDGVYRHFAPGETNRPILVQAAPDLVSPWGMRDFADKIWEWTESPVGSLHRAVRSGAWFLGNNKQSAGHFYCNPNLHYFRVGFRVARPWEQLADTVEHSDFKKSAIPGASDHQGTSPAASRAWTSGTHTMTVDGIERTFLLDLPKRLQRRAALVLVFHGYTGSAEGIRTDTGFTRLSEQHGFVAVYPQGTRDSRGNAFFNVGYAFHDGQKVDDINFARQLVGRLVVDLDLDPRAVFSTGMSNGGDMSYLLAAQPEPIVHAIAPVAGTMMASWSKDFVPRARTSVLAVHGTNDKITWWSGDMQNRDGWGAYLGVEAVADVWIRGLVLERSETAESPGGQDGEVQGVRLRRWTTDADTTEFRLYERTGGSHVWPHDLGDQDRSTAAEIWSFFHTHIPRGDR